MCLMDMIEKPESKKATMWSQRFLRHYRCHSVKEHCSPHVFE